MRRFFLKFDPKEKVFLEGEQFVHLAFVLRSKIGDRVILNRNDDFDYIYEIVRIDKKTAELKFIEKVNNVCNPKLNVRLYAALEKGEKMDLVVQKAVELGISEIIPINTTFCQVRPESVKIDRLQRIANEACKQCGRSKTVSIQNVCELKNLRFANDDETMSCFLYEGECSIDLQTFLNKTDKSKLKDINIIIGSEGGFSREEVDYLSYQGIKLLTLGHRILRSETACIAVSAIVMAAIGELK